MSAIDQFRQTLKAISTAVENAAIENFVYWQIILESHIISPDELKRLVEEALQDPQKRDEVHCMYSEMWQTLEKTGTDAFFEDLLRELSPTDKPN